MRGFLLGLLCLAAVSSSFATRTTYVGYKLLHVFPETAEQIQLIQKFEENPDFDIWNNAKGLKAQVDVLLSPSAFLIYKQIFNEHNIKFEVVDDNIQNKIDEQERSNLVAQLRNPRNIVGIFASHAQHLAFYDQVVDEAEVIGSGKWISTETIGTTHEGRPLKVLRFKKGNPLRKVWVDCGIHARERISPALCIALIEDLRKNHTTKWNTLLGYYEINILSIQNADGYEFARTTTPLWRKNRRRNTGSTCIGVDLNRNFGYKWMTGGSSNNPCSDTFAGPTADSEPETYSVQNFIKPDATKYDVFLTIHTYGLWWFTPWGYTDAILPPDYTDLEAKANIAAAAIKAVRGTSYVTGSSAEILYIASGGSDDWAKSVGIKHATTLELPPGQSGVDSNHGFLLPADRIPSVVLETIPGIIAFLNAIKADNLGK